eukprot:TRINITY_DN4581_c0_g1_i1.p1 TRINITY_DN4581_c0_g1~~TRINITY_DN4581_c0_g1_i1.p1  ORF type:complete len:357 (-),score=88.73 TRINITY_DN4581_c0_g1_i1:143-1213(-)
MVLLKIKNGDDLRRVALEPVTYKDLKATIQRLFQVAVDDNKAFSLTYQDDEGDNIGISSDIELAEALHFLTPAQPRPFLRLTLRVNTHVPTPVPVATPTPVAAPTPGPHQQPSFCHPLEALLKDNNLGNLFNMAFAAQGCPRQQQGTRQPSAPTPPPTAAPTPTPTPTPTHAPIPPCCFKLKDLGLDASAVRGIASELLANPEIKGLAQAFGVALPSDSEVSNLVSMLFPQPPTPPSTSSDTAPATSTSTSTTTTTTTSTTPTTTTHTSEPSAVADPDAEMVRNFWGADYDQYDDIDNNDIDIDKDAQQRAAEARLQEKLATMAALGFGSESANRAALQQAHGNVERAINVLLEHM